MQRDHEAQGRQGGPDGSARSSADGASITVLLVDDHEVLRNGYKRLIERSPLLRLNGEASTAADALRVFSETRSDVTVMDISLPDFSGIEALRRMLALSSGARVLMFSIHEEPIYAQRAFDAGARGYVTKASAPELLIAAIRAVARGEVVVSSDLSESLDAREEIDQAIPGLSTREPDIAQRLANGDTVWGIADRREHINTIANCRSAIRRTLGAPMPARLLQVATRRGPLMQLR